MERAINAIPLRKGSKIWHVNAARLVFRQVHIQLQKLQPQRTAKLLSLDGLRRFQQNRHSIVPHGCFSRAGAAHMPFHFRLPHPAVPEYISNS